jgi:hydrogenase/urease accessory protein HupE
MNLRSALLLLAGFLLICASCGTAAHEVRPGYLELRELSPGAFSVLWKVPMRGSARLDLRPTLPESCEHLSEVSSQAVGGAMIERWSVACEGDLGGKTIAVAGLEGTLTDVLVRIERSDSSVLTERLTPAQPYFEVTPAAGVWQVAVTYLGLGVEHILLGIDHLLFVLALLLIVKGWRTLVATITAFTLAHSITLAAATLGYVHVPQQPVEAVIALSILFLASEIVHARQGRPGVAQRRPWLVAFVFGLLHGFGFAGALTEIGLPTHAIPLALLFFNLGVELGQLLFVAAVLMFRQAIIQIPLRQSARTAGVAAYTIGGVAAYWSIERVAGFWG